MTCKPQPFREAARWLGPMLGLVLLLGSLALGLHRHHGAQEHRTCVPCTVGHTPAITADAAPSPAATPSLAGRAESAPASAPRATPPAATSPRAPPLG